MQTRLGRGRGAGATAAVALVLVGAVALAAPATADPADAASLEASPVVRPNDARAVAEDETESPVSTSPSELAAAGAEPRERLAGQGSDGLPLTRAAARRRVEAMTPVTWLSSFGPVTVGRPQ